MTIEANCSCGKVLRVKDEGAGKRVRCPKCKAVVVVPALPADVDSFADIDMPASPKALRRSGRRPNSGSRWAVAGWLMAIVVFLSLLAVGGAIVMSKRQAAFRSSEEALANSTAHESTSSAKEPESKKLEPATRAPNQKAAPPDTQSESPRSKAEQEARARLEKLEALIDEIDRESRSGSPKDKFSNIPWRSFPEMGGIFGGGKLNMKCDRVISSPKELEKRLGGPDKTEDGEIELFVNNFSQRYQVKFLQYCFASFAFDLASGQIRGVQIDFDRYKSYHPEIFFEPAAEEKDSIAKLKKLGLGARIRRDRNSTDNHTTEITLSGDRIDDVTLELLKPLAKLRKLELFKTKNSDAGLTYVASELSSIKELILFCPGVSDNGLSYLSKMMNLEHCRLVLHSANSSDAGLVHLKGLQPQLKELALILYGERFTDAGAQTLAELPRLAELKVFESPMTGKALELLSGGRALRKLTLHRTKISDPDLVHLRKLPNLEELGIGGSSITDEGLGNLAGLQRLRKLDLTETEVTDAGLQHLQGLKGLRELILEKTTVTEAGAKKLQERLPGLRVQR